VVGAADETDDDRDVKGVVQPYYKRRSNSDRRRSELNIVCGLFYFLTTGFALTDLDLISTMRRDEIEESVLRSSLNIILHVARHRTDSLIACRLNGGVAVMSSDFHRTRNCSS
jgi:hypothetical protein